MKLSGWLVAGLVLSCSAIQASTTWAELRLQPSISVREEYNDNIFLSRSRREDDFITIVNPAINMRYQAKALDVSLDYGLNFRSYADHSSENDTSLRDAQRAALKATLSPYRDIFFIRLTDDYSRVTVKERKAVATGDSRENKTDVNHFIINPYLDIPMSGSLRFNGGYQYENFAYKSEQGDDSGNHLFTATITNELTPQLSASIYGGYLLQRPELTEDYDRQDVGLKVSWKLSPRITLSGSIGKAWFDLERTGKMDSTTKNIRAEYQLSSLITLSAEHVTDFSVSVDEGTSKQKRSSASISYTGKIPVTLTAFESTKNFVSQGTKEEIKGVEISTSMQISPRMTGNLSGRIMESRYYMPDVTFVEDNEMYRLGLSLSYEFKIATVSIGYNGLWQDSNILDQKCGNNIVWMQARFAF